MLKVYQFLLNEISIIDTEAKTISFTYPHRLIKGKEAAETKRITKATVKKHSKNHGNEYVISKFILASFAEAQEDKKYFESWADKELIGTFADMDDLAEFVKSKYEQTKAVRGRYHFVNFDSDLWECLIALRQGKAESEFNKYNKKHDNELALFRVLEGSFN